MKTENFNRAKEIESEIMRLVSYKEPLESDRSYRFIFEIKGKLKVDNNEIYPHGVFSTENSCPGFLKEQLQDDLNFIADRLLNKINRRIAELEKEFKTL